MRLIDRVRAERAIQATPWGSWGEVASTWSGANVSTSSSLQLLTVYGCVMLIADSIATLPADVFRKTADGQEPAPAPAWLNQPTPYLDRTAWMTQVLISLLLDGNAYVWIVRNPQTMAISELHPLDPTKVDVRKDPGQPKTFWVAGKPYSSFEILHIPAAMFPGACKGLSPVEAARQTIGTGLAAQEFAARFFGQGMSPAGVVETTGEMPADKAAELARAIQRKHGGKGKAHLPLVLENATWKTTGVTNEQAQFLETRRFTAAEIAGQMFRVDPSELGIGVEGTSLTYANLNERQVRRVQVTFLPWIVRLENALSALLAQPRFMKLNVNGLLRGDTKSRFEAYQTGIRSDFLLRSEVREFEDLPPIDGIDDRPLPSAGSPAASAPSGGTP